MNYLLPVITKIILFPVVVVMLVPAYMLFVISPDLKSFKFKMGR